MSTNVELFAVYPPYGCACDVPKPASPSGSPVVLFILKAPPSVCSITISPVVNLDAFMFISSVVDVAAAFTFTAPFTSDTKVSDVVPLNVISIAVLVSLLVILVVPPSLLNSWKSATFGVASC